MAAAAARTAVRRVPDACRWGATLRLHADWVPAAVTVSGCSRVGLGQVHAALYAADHQLWRGVALGPPGGALTGLGGVVKTQREEGDEDDDQPEDDLAHEGL